jgi:tRNA(Ile)-lysidine synthase
VTVLQPLCSGPDADDRVVPVDAALRHAFADAMAALGPFERRPRIAAGVSGGADSMALACLADDWVRARDGSLLALVVDHGLRADSAREAAETLSRLATIGIAGRCLTVTNLTRGPALAARARDARYRALTGACADAGILHLLLGHHIADQAETLMIRVLSGSGGRGLAGMAALQETGSLRIVRPLLAVPPAALREFLRRAGTQWVEDPSNTDMRALRPRLRRLRGSAGGEADATRALFAAARSAGEHRAANERAIAAVLAERVTLWPEGFAHLSSGPIAPEALGELLRVIAGADFAPGLDQIAALAACPRPYTVWGVRLMPAGRLGDGLLVVREQAAIAPPLSVANDVIWDGRFRLHVDPLPLPDAMTVDALGADAARLRSRSNLPAAVLRTVPALRRGNILVAVPHLLYPTGVVCIGVRAVFSPPRPLASAPFVPA